MLRDVWPLVGAAAMRARDRHTIERLGVPGEVLMETAGGAVVQAVLEERRSLGREAPVLVVCGAGNNGGDGFVAARHLHQLGVSTRIALVAEVERLSGDAAANYRRAEAVGVPVASGRWRAEPGSVVVDALFGTGLSRAVEGDAAAAIRRIEQAAEACRVVAVDVPSGLDADRGVVLGVCAPADRTVTIGLPKPGLMLEPGRSLAGRVEVARVGIADQLGEAGDVASTLDEADAWVFTRSGAGARLPSRPTTGHKGTFGHVLVVAGSEGKTGAAALAAHGAARIGAGLVTIACPEALNAILEVKCTEAMTAPVAATAEHAFARGSEKALLELAASRDAVVMGPGVGRAPETLAVVRTVAPEIEAPLILDADGVVAFAEAPDALRARRGPTVLTPHPGEAATLLATTAAEINADRVGHARALCEATGAVVVLKGAATVVAAPDGSLSLNPTGGPGLATGGTGDVLAGAIGGLLAQGCAAADAARLGVYLHGDAADRLAAEQGDAGLLASDVATALPRALAAARAACLRDPAPLRAGARLAFPDPEGSALGAPASSDR